VDDSFGGNSEGYGMVGGKKAHRNLTIGA
jgi:hypothetical protein